MKERGAGRSSLACRVVSGFVIEGGDPLGDGSGGPGYTVVEEPPADLSYTRGVVAMAKTPSEPPGSAGSQFFVVTSHNAGFGAEYALLGEVSEGYGTVARINKLPAPEKCPSSRS